LPVGSNAIAKQIAYLLAGDAVDKEHFAKRGRRLTDALAQACRQS
jgi:hypothetical protein